ncbi:MAG: carbohydrate binding family 9 domain-containing protein [Saprospiraceae bacterium]|nr:carbohydrate binding family 9 domain-containing protein [Saprospiraceae bacterium]
MVFSIRTGLLFLLVGISMSVCLGQDAQRDYQLNIRPVQGEIVLDGRPDEAFWMLADSATNFWLKSPRLEPNAKPATVVRMAYDADFLYLAGWCEEVNDVNVQTLRRDVDYFRGDGLGVVLDPINEHTYGYFFGASPFGTQIDGIMLGIGTDVSTSWDGTFFSETNRTDRGWTLEMAIPLRTLRFDSQNASWGVQFVRNVFNQNEVQTWAPVPLQFGPLDINFTGLLHWQEPPTSRSTNISVIPYLLAGTQKEPAAAEPVQNTFNAGLDARIGLGSALNLDLTLNPDFSQVDIDEQPVNLTRFNIQLPERRTFFLENTDVFSTFGTDAVRPFFSRRIGLDEQGGAVPILFGGRLSGNVARDTRMGLLNMQTGATASTDAQNYTAISVRQQVFSRSTIGALVTNRQSFEDGKLANRDYGRTAGLEANYLTASGKVEALGALHSSFKPDIQGDNLSWATGAAYNGQRFKGYIEYSGAEENFYADMGFVQRVENYDASKDSIIRLGYHQLANKMTWTTYPSSASSIFNRHWLQVDNAVVLNPEGSLNESSHSLIYNLFFKDRRYFQVWSRLQQVDLMFPTTFVSGGEPLPADQYRYLQGGAFFDTDTRRPWYFLIGASGGQFYNGSILSGQTGVTYRVMPYGSLGLRLNYNHLDFPDDYGRAEIINMTTRLDITFTRNIFWTSFVQYNTQREIFNINSRFQWRFAPLSDLFVVYTDSYDTPGQFRDRVRTLVLKLNYWWTI